MLVFPSEFMRTFSARRTSIGKISGRKCAHSVFWACWDSTHGTRRSSRWCRSLLERWRRQRSMVTVHSPNLFRHVFDFPLFFSPRPLCAMRIYGHLAKFEDGTQRLEWLAMDSTHRTTAAVVEDYDFLILWAISSAVETTWHLYKHFWIRLALCSPRHRLLLKLLTSVGR